LNRADLACTDAASYWEDNAERQTLKEAENIFTKLRNFGTHYLPIDTARLSNMLHLLYIQASVITSEKSASYITNKAKMISDIPGSDPDRMYLKILIKAVGYLQSKRSNPTWAPETEVFFERATVQLAEVPEESRANVVRSLLEEPSLQGDELACVMQLCTDKEGFEAPLIQALETSNLSSSFLSSTVMVKNCTEQLEGKVGRRVEKLHTVNESKNLNFTSQSTLRSQKIPT